MPSPLLLVLIPLASLAAQRPPPVEAVLRTDSLVVDSLFLGDNKSTWPFQFVRAAPLGETWMILDDPFGGSFYGPSTMVAALGEQAAAFAERREARSVVFLPRPLTLLTLALLATGALAVSTLPFVLYRRRYGAERDRRRMAALALHHLAEGREAERVRTARDLHDGPVQDLHVLRMRLSLASRTANQGQREALTEIAAEIQRVGLELRHVAGDLRPPALGPFGLATALRAFVDRFRRSHPNLAVELDLDDDNQTIPGPTRLVSFRVAQEAMNNAAKHASPSQISVALRLGTDEVTLEVADNGTGFDVPRDPSAPTRPGHYGLVGMAERAVSVSGLLEIKSRPGAGTRVRVRTTLAPHAEGAMVL